MSTLTQILLLSSQFIPRSNFSNKSASFESVDVDLESNIGSKDISKLDSDRSHNDSKRKPSICTRSINYTSSESSERSSIKDPLLSPNDIGKVRSQVYGSAVKSKSKKKPIMEICKDIPPMKLNFNALNTSGDSLAPLEKVNRFSGMSINKKDEIQKKLVHLRIDPILIYKHEYDLLRLPETRGHKINFEAKVEDQPSQFEIVEKYGQTIRRNFKNCGLWIIALLILLVFTFCVIIYIKYQIVQKFGNNIENLNKIHKMDKQSTPRPKQRILQTSRGSRNHLFFNKRNTDSRASSRLQYFSQNPSRRQARPAIITTSNSTTRMKTIINWNKSESKIKKKLVSKAYSQACKELSDFLWRK